MLALAGILWQCSLPLSGVSQDLLRLPGTYGITGRISYGFLIAHREALMPLQEAHLRSAELSISRLSTGTSSWEEDFRLPETGFQLEVIDPGTEKLRTTVAVYPYVDFPLLGISNRKVWFRYGIGLGYITKTFDPKENFKNAAIGSHINGVLHLDLHYRGAIGEHSALEIGIGITHFSNGSTKVPNLGINLPKIDLGYRRYIGDPVSVGVRKTEPSIRPASWQVYLAGAVKETYPVLGKKYPAGTANVLYTFSTVTRSRFGVGADFFFDASLAARYARINGSTRPNADFRPGLYGAWQMRIGAVGIGFNMGIYPYSVYKEDGFFYHRIGLRYHLKHLFVCTNLKTHYARADFIEWGIGWEFR